MCILKSHLEVQIRLELLFVNTEAEELGIAALCAAAAAWAEAYYEVPLR